MVEITGIRSSASSRSRMAGLTVSTSPTIAELRAAGAGHDQTGVLARQPDRDRAVLVDGGHDVAADLAHQHHAGHVEAVGVGHPETVAELRLHAQPLHQLADLRSASVDHHRPNADGAHEDDVVGEGPGQVGVDHGRTAVLDDDGRAAEPVDVGQRLDQNRSPRRRLDLEGPDHVRTFPCSRRCRRGSDRWSACRPGPVPRPRSAVTSRRRPERWRRTASSSWSTARPSRPPR